MPPSILPISVNSFNLFIISLGKSNGNILCCSFISKNSTHQVTSNTNLLTTSTNPGFGKISLIRHNDMISIPDVIR